MKTTSAKYPWVVVGLLWGVALLNYLDRQMLSTMKPTMMLDIPQLQSATYFGQLMAVFLWIYGFMSPVAGLLADRISKAKLIVGSLFVWSCVTLLMGYATNYQQLYVLRALMGVSEALYIPAGLALIANYHSSSTRSLAVGIHMTGLYMGQALGGFGATIAHQLSWATSFQIFGMIGMMYAILLFLFLRDPVTTPNASQPTHTSTPVLFTLRKLAGLLPFWVILFYFASSSLPGWAVKNWLPTLIATNLQLEMSIAGPLSTISIAFSSLVGVILGGLLSDRWVQTNLRGRILVSAMGLSLTLPALLFIVIGSNLFFVLGAAVCFGFGFGLFDANNMPILCQFIPAHQRAAAYGFMNMTGVFAGAFITDLLGRSMDAGHLGSVFLVMGIVVCVALLLQLLLLKPTTHNADYL
jgi:MFS family permease